MGRGIVLALLSRFKVILSGRQYGLVPDAMPAAKSG
jgi:hypothetical protein